MSEPARGEVWQVDLGMTAKIRPCLVLSNPPGSNDLALYTIVPHTTALRGNAWEVPINKNFLKSGAFHVQQIQSISHSKFTHKLGVLTEQELATIEQKIRRLFGWRD